ncbi:MAG: hypothetical protein ACK5NN_10925 [Sphingomonadaceae bacterium]
MVTQSPSVFSLQFVLHQWRAEWSMLNRHDRIYGAGLFLAVLIVSFYRLEWSHNAILVNNCILGADPATYGKALESGTFLGLRVHKHALAVLLISIISQFLIWLGFSPLLAGIFALAFIQALASALIYLFMRQRNLPGRHAAAMTVLVLATFGMATMFGIIETYGVTVLAIIAACLCFPTLARTAPVAPLACATLCAVLSFILATANAPALAFIAVFYSCLWHQMPRIKAGYILSVLLVPAIGGVIGVLLPALMAEGSQGAVWHENYLSRYANWGNFTDWTTISNYLVNCLIFSFVAPMEFIRCRFVAGDLMEMVARPLNLIAYFATASLLITGIIRSIKSDERSLVAGLLIAAAALMLFYLYFNPDEALLYSPQWIVALCLAAVPALPRILPWILVAACLCIWVNIPALHHARTINPEMCCPTPPATMMEREHPSELVKQLLRQSAGN